MTLPAFPRQLLSLEEFFEFPEDSKRRFELQEGVPVVSPAAGALQQQVGASLAKELRRQLPPGWAAITGPQVITDSGFPPSVWVPDVVVVATETMSGDVRRFAAEQVLLAVEIISLGSRGIDTVLKPAEYAEAGIPFYWVVDLDPLSLVAYHLAEDGRYQQVPAATRKFETSEPFSLQVDLTELAIWPERGEKADD